MTKDMRPISATDSRIRNNLILKLGVVKQCEEQQPTRSKKSMLGNVEVSTEPLKSKVEENIIESHGWGLSAFFSKSPATSTIDLTALASTPCDSSCSETSSVAHKRLTFNETVQVCPIPKHQAYSKRIKAELWNSPEEIMANATRNSIEFAAEGWDWRNTLEDENMYTCVGSNEKIHPIHVQNQLEQEKRQH